ncbi:MAG: T9SS type A sorting domain-containing protein [Bacteroidetes bacterium]|nr:T9SS type A sorting domain-containing protein [Bacteroidota bacterium]
MGLASYSLEQTVNPNLVQNPSFENFVICPNARDQFDSPTYPNNAVSWENPTLASPDLFNACDATNFVGVPNNIQGFQTAHDINGTGYAGVVTFTVDFPFSSDYWREYLETPVNLQQGVKYTISYWAALSSNSGWATRNLGAYLSPTHISKFSGIGVTHNPLPITPDYENNNYLDVLGLWVQQSFEYTPQTTGTYYLIIGDFSGENYRQPTINNSTNGEAYYFIDDVVIKEHPGCCPDNLTISDQTLSGTEIFGANNTITVGPNVTVAPNSNITLVANGEIDFLPGSDISQDVDAFIGECPGNFQTANSPALNIPHNTAIEITPDGDGNADEVCFSITGSPTYTVEVKSLADEVVYVVNNAPVDSDPMCVWNGTCNFGALCNGGGVAAGFYVMTITVTGCDGLPISNSFFVQVSYPNGRLAMTNEGVIDSGSATGLQLYPNPANDKFYLENILPGSIIRLIDESGQIIYEEKLSNSKEEIPATQFARGIYFVEINDGAKITMKKLVLQ